MRTIFTENDFKVNDNLSFEGISMDMDTSFVENAGDVLNMISIEDSEISSRYYKICSINSKYFLTSVIDGLPNPHPIRFYPNDEFRKAIDTKLISL